MKSCLYLISYICFVLRCNTDGKELPEVNIVKCQCYVTNETATTCSD